MSTKLSDHSRTGESLNDNSVLAFGIHEGKKLANVPARYLRFLYENGKCPDNLKEYIRDNWVVLKNQERQEHEQQTSKYPR